jgi:predicted regulator of Ras-like GTPase activity (Roadblock/LC7/MglB family)
MPDALASIVRSTEGDVTIPLSLILPQLSRGQIRIRIAELVRSAPPGALEAAADQMDREICLPLSLVLPLVSPRNWTTRDTQIRPQLPPEVRGLYTQNGDTVILSRTAPLQPARRQDGELSETEPSPPDAAAAPAPPSSTQAAEPAPAPPEPVAKEEPAPPIRFFPKAPAVTEAEPEAVSAVRSGPSPETISAAESATAFFRKPSPATRPSEGRMAFFQQPATPPPKSDDQIEGTAFFRKPASRSGPAAAPPTAFRRKTASNSTQISAGIKRPGPAANCIMVALAELAEDWPETIRLEIATKRWWEAWVQLPLGTIEPGLKAGAVVLSWSEIIQFLSPPADDPASDFGDVSLKLSLSLVTPLFLAKKRLGALVANAPAPEASSFLPSEPPAATAPPVALVPAATPAPEPEREPVSAPVPALPDLAPPDTSLSMPVIKMVLAADPAPAIEPEVPSVPASAERAESPDLQPVDSPATDAASSRRWRRSAPKGVMDLPPVNSSTPPPTKLDWPFRSVPAQESASRPPAHGIEKRTPEAVVEEAFRLQGVSGVLITTDDGNLIAARVEAGSSPSKSSAFFCLIYSKMSQLGQDVALGQLGEVKLYFDDIPWFICRADRALFVVKGRLYEPLPEAQLRALVAELSSLPSPILYGDHQPSDQGTEVKDSVLRPPPWWENNQSGANS